MRRLQVEARALPALLWPATLLLLGAAIPMALLLRVSIAPRQPGALWGAGIAASGFGAAVATDPLHALGYSIAYTLAVAVIAVGIGFPATYLITRLPRRGQVGWLLFLLSTLALSDVLVAFAWQVMLSRRGGMPGLLAGIGLTAPGASLVPGPGAVVCCLVYIVLPIVILILYPPLSRLDQSLVEAARTMGAGPIRSVLSVVLPASRIPVLGAFVMAVVMTMGAYAAPVVLGRPDNWTLAVLISHTALAGEDMPGASAMALCLLVATLALAFGGRWALGRLIR